VDEERAHPLFGTPGPGRAYTGRFGAYRIARSGGGLIAAVEDDDGKLYFPGGGVLPGELATSAHEREAREECGRMVAVGELLGRAFQIIDTQGERGFLLDARYLRLSVLSADRAPAEHRVVWLPAKTCAERMHRAGDRWLADQRLADGFQAVPPIGRSLSTRDSEFGPPLPTCLLHKVGGLAGYCGRRAQVIGTAVGDPKRSF
jgi:ADP-ribose pyrophosphatase YjhB (NUDIX family)